METSLDYTITQRWSEKREEFDFLARVYVDGEVFAERRWSHPDAAVLSRMCRAFFLSCDASIYNEPVEVQQITNADGDTQLTLW